MQPSFQIDPKESRILLTDPPLNPKSNRETMVNLPCDTTTQGRGIQLQLASVFQIQTMFEEFNFSAAFIQIQAVLTLYSQGLSAGILMLLSTVVSYVSIFPSFSCRIIDWTCRGFWGWSHPCGVSYLWHSPCLPSVCSS